MPIKQIRKDLWGIMVNDWDRRLFDELIPLPEGTSYNSYIIRDEKTVLIDSADPSKTGEFIAALKKTEPGRIDYIVSNHSEQDHSGSIPELLSIYPEAEVLTSEKGAAQLNILLGVEKDKIKAVTDGQQISTGNYTLQFKSAPWVHWPETIFTYWQEGRVLFPCDLFGSHMASSRFYSNGADEIIQKAAKRYYAEIMMPFRKNISKYLEALQDFEIEFIAPSHGPVHNKPEPILNAYADWVSDSVKNEVVIPYVSMHGSTGAMVDRLINSLLDKGISVKPFNLTVTDTGELAMSLVDAATVVIGSPTVLTGPHPYALNAVYLFKLLRPKTRFASVVGSFGWGGNMLQYIQDMLPVKNLEVIEPVIIKGYPGSGDFEKIDRLAEEIKIKHHEAGLLDKNN